MNIFYNMAIKTVSTYLIHSQLDLIITVMLQFTLSLCFGNSLVKEREG